MTGAARHLFFRVGADFKSHHGSSGAGIQPYADQPAAGLDPRSTNPNPYGVFSLFF